MKIGITGAGGYIGSLVTKMALKNNDMVAIDNFYQNQVSSIDNQKIEKADIRNLSEVEQLLGDCDSIIHLAAISSVPECDSKKKRAYETNIIGTQNIAYICRENNIPLAFASSMAIFGEPQNPIKETAPKNPLNFYGLTKLIGMGSIEKMVKPSISFIISNVYGSHELDGKEITKDNVINRFVEQAKSGEPLTVYKPGTQARDFVHVKDVARIFLESLDKLNKLDSSQTVNLASGNSYSIKQIAGMVANETGSKIALKKNPRSEAIAEKFSVDISQLEKLGLKPKIQLEQAIKEMF